MPTRHDAAVQLSTSLSCISIVFFVQTVNLYSGYSQAIRTPIRFRLSLIAHPTPYQRAGCATESPASPRDPASKRSPGHRTTHSTMIQSTRNWLRRNRTNFAIGAGVLGTAYLAGQYALGKFSEARQRMSEERIAKENLRRRFEQNQEDCTFTVLAILPTATEKILDAIPVEQVLEELQRQKAERLARSVGPSEIASSAPPSVVDTTEDGTRSSVQDSESYVHASQVALEEGSIVSGETSTDAAGEKDTGKASKKSKAQLWNEMKISCKSLYCFGGASTDLSSDNPRIHAPLHNLAPHTAHPHSTQPSRPPQLPRLCCLTCVTSARRLVFAHQPRK